MRFGCRGISASLSWCVRQVIVGLVLISGSKPWVFAQGTSSQPAADPTKIPALPAPKNPTKQAFGISSKPSLIYKTTRDSKTGSTSLKSLEVAPNSDPLVFQFQGDGLPCPAVEVALTFTFEKVSKKCYLPAPVLVSGQKYTVASSDLNPVLVKLLDDLNDALPSSFNPANPLGFTRSVQVDVTPIHKAVLSHPLEPGQKIVYDKGTTVSLAFVAKLKRILGKDDSDPLPAVP